LTVVEAPRLRSHIVRGPEISWQHLAATCSIPVVFPPVRIGGKLSVDGGFLGALPLWAAEEMGARPRASSLRARFPRQSRATQGSWLFSVASSEVEPYTVTPGSSRTSAIQRPSISLSKA
jgi:predicted acylesterase/phospholipase RssA